MSFIEGIGDEVALFFVIVFVFAVAALITLVGSGSVPPVETHIIGSFQYEQISTEQRENIEAPASSNSTVRHRYSPPPVGSLQANSFVIEDEITDNEDVGRTEGDGISVERTEADGSAEDTPQEESVEEESLQPGEIHVRLKYLNDTERIVTTNLSTKIGDFKKKHFREVVRENKIVRLIFAGRLLQDNSTIQECRILENSVVHVQILPAQTGQRDRPLTQDSDVDVGRLFIPSITLILGMCWVLYSKYPEFFSTLSLGVLGTFSCFFLAYIIQSRR